MPDSPQSAETPPGAKRNVWLLGWVSLFNDMASEMLYPIMPLFLTATLGASPAILGVVDGVAEGIGSCLRWVGGALSDRFRRRKPFVFAGYSISAFSKPIMGLAAFVLGWPMFLIGRCADRMGKSVRNGARDALLAASADDHERGRAFGFQRAMDTCGAVLGPLIALAALGAMAGWHTVFHASYKSGAGSQGHADALAALPLKWLYFAALAPGVIAVLCVLAVREIKPRAGDRGKSGGKPPPIFQSYPATLWKVALAALVFSLGNSSDTFLILRSSQLGLTFGWIMIAYAMYNVVYAAGAQPMGRLSDRIGRKPLLVGGWSIYALVYVGFALFRAAWAPWLLLGVYGLYQAMTDGVIGALISDIVPDEKRAGAMGLYYTATGLGQLAASIVAGLVYGVFVMQGRIMLPFLLGAVCAVAAVAILASVKIKRAA